MFINQTTSLAESLLLEKQNVFPRRKGKKDLSQKTINSSHRRYEKKVFSWNRTPKGLREEAPRRSSQNIRPEGLLVEKKRPESPLFYKSTIRFSYRKRLLIEQKAKRFHHRRKYHNAFLQKRVPEGLMEETRFSHRQQ